MWGEFAKVLEGIFIYYICGERCQAGGELGKDPVRVSDPSTLRHFDSSPNIIQPHNQRPAHQFRALRTVLPPDLLFNVLSQR
jgi:hypothetical protein